MASFFGCEYEVGRSSRDEASFRQTLMSVIDIIRPKPSPVDLIRIGGDSDGAYLVPDDLSGIEACFSPGVNNAKPFEDELAIKYGIKSHMCDYSSSEHSLATPLIDGLQTFRKSWLDIEGAEDSISLADWVAELAPHGHSDLILQMDIEGAEYRNILTCPTSIIDRLRIFVLEIHSLSAILDADILDQIIAPFFLKLSHSFDCVHAHANNCCGEVSIPGTGMNLPHTMELTFFKRDRIVSSDPSHHIVPMLPHPLDIDRNVLEFAPITLNDRWLASPRSLDSRLKLIEERLSYQNYVLSRLFVQSGEINGLMNILGRMLNTPGAPTGAVVSDASNDRLAEVATGRDYVLTSAYGSFSRRGVVPTNGGAFFFHTDFGFDQSITIDLGKSYDIEAIEIENRRDCCFERARLLFVALHSTPETRDEATFHFELSDDFAAGKLLMARLVVPQTAARYVTILSAAHTALHLSAIRVFAAKD